MLTLTLEIVIVLALIGINGLLAMSELALVSSQRFRLQQKAESGDEGAARALALATEPTRYLSTIQIGITLVAIVAGAFGGARIATRIAGWLEDAGASTGVSDSVSVVLVILVIAYLSLVLGELAPKRVALRQPERIAARIARPIQLLAHIGAPFVTILSASTSAVLRPFGVRAHEEAPITEEEIRLLIGLSAQSGSVAEAEAKLLERVFPLRRPQGARGDDPPHGSCLAGSGARRWRTFSASIRGRRIRASPSSKTALTKSWASWA